MAKKKTASKSRKSAKEDKESIEFEAALAEAEEIVGQLETGELGLAESLEHYELGIKRLNQCHQSLEKAERRIQLLSGFDADGNPITQPFDSELGDVDWNLEDRSPRKAGRARSSAGQQANLDEDTDTDLHEGGLF